MSIFRGTNTINAVRYTYVNGIRLANISPFHFYLYLKTIGRKRRFTLCKYPSNIRSVPVACTAAVIKDDFIVYLMNKYCTDKDFTIIDVPKYRYLR